MTNDQKNVSTTVYSITLLMAISIIRKVLQFLEKKLVTVKNNNTRPRVVDEALVGEMKRLCEGLDDGCWIDQATLRARKDNYLPN